LAKQYRQKPTTSEERGMPVKLFISYAHKDEDFRQELNTHLKLMQRQKLIDAWHDRQILPGQEWAGEIDEALQDARVILLLVSANFLASDYCYDKEMLRALERYEQKEAIVIPIILSACDWHSAPFGKLQGLPKDAKPIKSWNDRDEAWTDVARGIRRVIENLSKLAPAPPSAVSTAAQPAPGGERNVAISGATQGSTIITGDNNNVIINQPAATKPSTAAAPSGELDFKSKQRLTDALLACACLQTPAAREQVIGELPDALGNRIQRHAAAKQDVLSLVTTCLDYETGLSSLLEIIEFHDGGTQAWSQLQAVVGEVLPQ
jgi:hypothetical protein